MKLFMDILFFIVIGYYGYKFYLLMIKMKQIKIVPTSNEELTFIRKSPQKPVDFPSYSKQKVGIILYVIMLLFVVIVYFIGIFLNEIDWSYYLLLFLPLSYSQDFLKLFAVLEDGIISGSRFIAWKRIKSFNFVPIDVSHKYYGYTKEVNNGYELIIKEKFTAVSCIVTSNEMKDKLTKILSEHLTMKAS